jgi:hypothetical protein
MLRWLVRRKQNKKESVQRADKLERSLVRVGFQLADLDDVEDGVSVGSDLSEDRLHVRRESAGKEDKIHRGEQEQGLTCLFCNSSVRSRVTEQQRADAVSLAGRIHEKERSKTY